MNLNTITYGAASLSQQQPAGTSYQQNRPITPQVESSNNRLQQQILLQQQPQVQPPINNLIQQNEGTLLQGAMLEQPNMTVQQVVRPAANENQGDVQPPYSQAVSLHNAPQGEVAAAANQYSNLNDGAQTLATSDVAGIKQNASQDLTPSVQRDPGLTASIQGKAAIQAFQQNTTEQTATPNVAQEKPSHHLCETCGNFSQQPNITSKCTSEAVSDDVLKPVLIAPQNTPVHPVKSYSGEAEQRVGSIPLTLTEEIPILQGSSSQAPVSTNQCAMLAPTGASNEQAAHVNPRECPQHQFSEEYQKLSQNIEAQLSKVPPDLQLHQHSFDAQTVSQSMVVVSTLFDGISGSKNTDSGPQPPYVKPHYSSVDVAANNFLKPSVCKFGSLIASNTFCCDLTSHSCYDFCSVHAVPPAPPPTPVHEPSGSTGLASSDIIYKQSSNSGFRQPVRERVSFANSNNSCYNISSHVVDQCISHPVSPSKTLSSTNYSSTAFIAYHHPSQQKPQRVMVPHQQSDPTTHWHPQQSGTRQSYQHPRHQYKP